jgi:DNA-binding protein HU-beta
VIVNKSQLVKVVSESTSSTRRAVEDVVDVLFDTIVTEVRSGRKVTVIGFGAFSPTARGPRIGRNPRTGAVVPIPASKGVRFATGSTFKSALNPKEGVSMAVKKAAAKRTVRKAPAKKTAARKATAKKAVKKAPARKTAAKKTAAKRTVKKAPARKTAAKKTAAKRTAKKAPARKTTARKTAARKTTAKRTAKKAPARKTAARKTTAKRTAKKAPARKVAKRTVRKARK